MARGSTPGDADRGPVLTHEVVAGETLWSIARGVVGPAGDPRPVIERIREANALETPTLLPGQELEIPSA